MDVPESEIIVSSSQIRQCKSVYASDNKFIHAFVACGVAAGYGGMGGHYDREIILIPFGNVVENALVEPFRHIAYLAMGFHARLVTCMPKKFINDCHVINAVYSNTLDKWLWVDPTHSAMVYDADGNPLGIQEVREYLRKDIPVKLNEDANWNNRSKTTVQSYLYSYMAKNLYYVQCELNSCYDSETRKKGKPKTASVSLCPEGYTPDAPKYSLSKYNVTDDAWFWQSPYTK